MCGCSAVDGAEARVDSLAMSVDPELLAVLVCPKDKGPLEYHEDVERLVNPRLGIAYRVDDGIPVLLVEEAEPWQSKNPA